MKSEPSSTSICITPLFEMPGEEGEINQQYKNVILRNLKRILPPHFFEAKASQEETLNHQRKLIQQLLPLITFSEVKSFPGTISFFALSKYRSNSFKFFFEMINRWLIPGKKMNLALVYASDFRLSNLSDQVYTICEVMITIDNKSEFEEIQKHFPVIGTEIVLGIDSAFYAQRILEVKGLASDEKTALIQSSMAFLVKRLPHAYSDDLFNEMQHVLVVCRDEFKAIRKARHLTRIISIQYLFRKSLRELVKKNTQRRYLSLKMFKAYIQIPTGGVKRVLAILVGINFIRDQEVFGEKHLLKAIQHYIPCVQSIEQSFFINKLASENICVLYLEVEKKDGTDFTNNEIRQLRRELPAHLKSRIEHKLHPIFMPRNEEEIMRNILILSNQIKYIRDIPQVFISFDEQAHSHLFFTIILTRVLKEGSCSIQELFKKSDSLIEYLHDRTKVLGYIRKRHTKEATVFRLKLPKDNFLRSDHSIDLYKARQAVVSELSRVIGEVRDYNGGMISKQHELLSNIRQLLVDSKGYDELLMENFFYSLSPVIVRALLDPKAFKILFLMLLEGIKDYKQEGYYVKCHREGYHIFALIVTEDMQIKDLIHQTIYDLHLPSTELATAYVKVNNLSCMGYISWTRDPQKKEMFSKTIESSLQNWELSHPKGSGNSQL